MNETSIGICAKNGVFPSLSVYATLSPLYVTLYLALPPILSKVSGANYFPSARKVKCPSALFSAISDGINSTPGPI